MDWREAEMKGWTTGVGDVQTESSVSQVLSLLLSSNVIEEFICVCVTF